MPKKDKVIVIIVSYNGQEHWPGLMPLLTQEKYDDFDLEILVVDNNSKDNSVAYLEQNFPEVSIIKNKENSGFVGGNNIGYKYALRQEADFIYLLNQDTVITPGFLRPLYNFAKDNSRIGSLQSKLKLWPDKHKLNTVGNAIHFLGFGYGQQSGMIDKENQKPEKIDYASGAGVFVSLAALKDLGTLFDETMFLYLEDLDLGWSLNMLGYDNYFIPDSVIYHKYEFDRSMRNYYWFERNRLWNMLKNYKLATLVLIFPAWLFMEFGQLFFALLKGRLGLKLKAYAWLFSGRQLQILREKRKYIQSKRKRSDWQVVGSFKGVILFQPLDSFLLKIANIFFGVYWFVIKRFIFW
ncbi:glycosyltransferase family 2 protein [Candidatus Parcubacteria bacterium]|nr:MAG: glycosyltransferase family 2 protein [Candidatus Parcubacteria bacterium]